VILQRYVQLAAGVGVIVCAQHATAQQIVTTARVSIDSDSMTSVLNRLVTVRLHHVSLRQAVDAIASAAQTRVQYQNSILDAVSQPVSLRVVQVRLAQAFNAVLSGTALQVIPLGRDVVSIELVGDSTQHGAGAILGTVTDVGSKEPIPAANVTILGTNIHVLTDANGQFRIAGVAEGVSIVRVTRLGLQPREQRVAVVANQTVRVTIPLTRVAQSLEQVVTTATGDRRRLEVGNSIGTINADSVVSTTLIRNMSDLLQARTPGVVVSNTGGSVGEPSRIRIRGINSIQLNNDPVIIVDGVRLQSQTTGGSTYSPTGTQGTSLNSGSVLINDNQQFGFAPSRLDDIDPNSIESIDVLKGPSAASLYGTDAANGVIVIKTKRGQPGRWRLSATGDDGWSAIPGSMPAMWYGWGHSVDNYSLVSPGYYEQSCTLTSVDATGPVYTVTDNTCVQDSVTSWSPLNDKYLTTIGTGTSRSVSASLSGGTDQLTEFLSGRGGSDVGIAKMSDAEKSRFTQTLAQDIPSWMLHPNTQQTYNLTSRTSIKVGSAFDLGLTAAGTYRDVLNAGTGLPTGANYSQYQGVTSPADTLWYLPSETQLVKG
jgi:TonB-dependent SusC/RagA subfamily outer membrane receptor